MLEKEINFVLYFKPFLEKNRNTYFCSFEFLEQSLRKNFSLATIKRKILKNLINKKTFSFNGNNKSNKKTRFFSYLKEFWEEDKERILSG